ncbi:MAG TPA: CHASE2 domain-containing protein [Thermoleophilaceae bacterium]|nr:CHASE2 domain-containing protein [Thermoleophilaceae bacterium]
MRRAPVTAGPAAALALIVALAFAVGVAAQVTGALGGLERATVEARFGIRGAEKPRDVAVVAIDDKTFGDLRQQWPFPRSLHGRVVRRLHAAGAREIVYDVQFTEPSEPREDEALYRAIDDVGGAVLATSESDGRGNTQVLGGDENLRAAGSEAAASDLSNDKGSVNRFRHDVAGLDTLATAAARRVGGPRVAPELFAGGGAWIDYRGPAGTVPSVSFSDVLRGQFPAEAVRGRVVVVGAAAPTLRDVHPTPAGDELMAGAEVQANAIWTALHGAPLRSAPGWLSLVLIALLALVAPVAGWRLPGLGALAVVVGAGLAFLVGAQMAFHAGVMVPVVAPLLALLAGSVAFIAWSRLSERRARLDALRDKEILEARVRERTDELWQTQLEVVRRLGRAVDWRDGDTGEHVDRIGRFCEQLGLAAGMGEAEAELLRHASLLHDVGKVGIPDRILNKPGPLDDEEWEVMKTHTTIGASILEGAESELMELARSVALTHHESWDGAGYPAGLRGAEIPLAGRICAVCDVFDALLSPRPYKDPWPLDEVLAELQRLRGIKFDPLLLDAFLALAPELYEKNFAPTAGVNVVSGDRGGIPA